MRRTTDKVAIITGAGSGIGRAASLALAAEGALVVATDIRDDAAKLVAEEIRTAGGRALAMRHDAAEEVDWRAVPFHVMEGPYRGPGCNSNAFFLETFIDECAVKAGIDPLEYRLKLYGKWGAIGWTKCLKEVAAKAGWEEKLPRGQGRGIAIANWGMDGKPEAGTTCATVAKVEVSKSGQLKILQIDVAFDMGRVMHRDAVATQIEGGTLFGLNMSLNEELNIKGGRIVEGNYDEYPMIRMADVPRSIHVHFGGLSDNPRFNEIGEPPVGPIGPAVGNAIFQATGNRIRTTPLRKLDLTWT